MSFQVPDVNEHKDSCSFFRRFVEVNRNANRKFSTRFLAKRLAWPASYLTDLTSGRKSLTISRAVQFAKVAELDEFSTERLILMAIRDKEDPVAKQYATAALSSRYEETIFADAPVTGAPFSEVETLAVLDLLLWLGEIPEVAAIKKMLPTFASWSDQRLREIVQFVSASGLFEVDEKSGRLRQVHDYLQFDSFLDGANRRSRGLIHKQYAENFIRFCDSISPPLDLNSGFVALTESQFEVLRHKLLILRNWLFKAAQHNQGSGSKGAALLYQYDFNVFSIVARDALSETGTPGRPGREPSGMRREAEP